MVFFLASVMLELVLFLDLFFLARRPLLRSSDLWADWRQLGQVALS